ncbi:hypothetical protein CC99x_000335 [Candidatus Berkiella cookevillensis]|uniref:Uncharacterized protein n=1 Tax=Candidatus Berkiella cookevillensis TaxID=437022 RepID=A0AAE3L4Y7_9GAMM|nr:hypothetical protein [Candidatus Berkiella cookevillensis]MCS5707340.1 hypothetical protein [Candidatus Berkiella cookevillensis]
MSINHAWFGAEYSGRLAEWGMALLIDAIKSNTMQSYVDKLNRLKSLRGLIIMYFLIVLIRSAPR